MTEREAIACWLRNWGAGWPDSGNPDFDAGFDQAIRSAVECIRDGDYLAAQGMPLREDPKGLRSEGLAARSSSAGCALSPSNPSSPTTTKRG